VTGPGRLRAVQARGGRLIVVDPRRSRTAKAANRHVPIRPGGDVHLLLGMVHELFAAGLVAPGRLAGHVNGLAELPELVRPFAPDVVGPRCGVEPAVIRELAHELAAAELAKLIRGAQFLEIEGRDHMKAVGDAKFKQGVLDFLTQRP